MNQGGDNWLMNVKHEFNRLGLNYIWKVPFIDDSTYKLIKERLLDVYKQQCYNRITATAKGNLFKHLINEFRLQTYLTQPLDFRYLKEIAKIRMSAHKLNIELGRYNNIERSERICILCDAKEIEDEYHFIIQCPRYSNLRNAHIKQYYHRRPNVLKLVQLLSTTSIKELSNLGKYLERGNKLRNKLLE